MDPGGHRVIHLKALSRKLPRSFHAGYTLRRMDPRHHRKQLISMIYKHDSQKCKNGCRSCSFRFNIFRSTECCSCCCISFDILYFTVRRFGKLLYFLLLVVLETYLNLATIGVFTVSKSDRKSDGRSVRQKIMEK